MARFSVGQGSGGGGGESRVAVAVVVAAEDAVDSRSLNHTTTYYGFITLERRKKPWCYTSIEKKEFRG